MLNKISFLKNLFVLLLFGAVFLSGINIVSAKDIDPTTGESCKLGVDNCLDSGGKSYDCMEPCVEQVDGSKLCTCQYSAAKTSFGKIQAPAPLAKLLEKDKTGAGAISTLLSNAVNLIFSIAAVVLLFMVLWGAFDWMISEGDKEKIAAARSKILNAMIGLILIAIAFAIVRLLSQFTGFTFFKGQNPPFKYIQDAQGKIMGVDCLNGTQLYSQQAIFNPAVECEKSKGR